MSRFPAQDPLEGHPTFRSVRQLSSGSFGFVYLAAHRLTGEVVAIKFLERDRIGKYLLNEVLNHRQLSSRSSHTGDPHSHPHVIEFKVGGAPPCACCLPAQSHMHACMLPLPHNRACMHTFCLKHRGILLML